MKRLITILTLVLCIGCSEPKIHLKERIRTEGWLELNANPAWVLKTRYLIDNGEVYRYERETSTRIEERYLIRKGLNTRPLKLDEKIPTP